MNARKTVLVLPEDMVLPSVADIGGDGIDTMKSTPC